LNNGITELFHIRIHQAIKVMMFSNRNNLKFHHEFFVV
jgi:hypothetical protein